MTMLLAFLFQSPGRVLQLGPISIRWYGFLIATALLIGITLSQTLAKRRQVNPDLIGDLCMWLVLAALPSARLYYVLFEWEKYVKNPGDIIAIWNGGIAIHGAIIGGTIAAIIFARVHKSSFWQLTDLIVPSLILGQAIGRWGNFFNSEAFGVPTNLPWKLFIPPANRPPMYMDKDFFHPTFLYESLWDLMIFTILINIFLWSLKNKNKDKLKVGTLTCLYLVGYSLGRVWIEGLRTDSLMLGFLRMAQVVSLIGMFIGIVGLVWLYWLKRPLPDVPQEPHSKPL